MKKGMVLAKGVLPLLLLVAATGCTQPTEEVHYIKVDMIACSFQGTDAVPVRITISSNPGPWSAEPSASWIRITEQTEEGIVLTADDNPASTEREGEITVTAGEMTKTIRVTPDGRHVRTGTIRRFPGLHHGSRHLPQRALYGGLYRRSG